MKHRSATLLLLLLVLCLVMPVWAFSEAAGDTVDILFLGTPPLRSLSKNFFILISFLSYLIHQVVAPL